MSEIIKREGPSIIFLSLSLCFLLACGKSALRMIKAGRTCHHSLFHTSTSCYLVAIKLHSKMTKQEGPLSPSSFSPSLSPLLPTLVSSHNNFSYSQHFLLNPSIFPILSHLLFPQLGKKLDISHQKGSFSLIKQERKEDFPSFLF